MNQKQHVIIVGAGAAGIGMDVTLRCLSVTHYTIGGAEQVVVNVPGTGQSWFRPRDWVWPVPGTWLAYHYPCRTTTPSWIGTKSASAWGLTPACWKCIASTRCFWTI